MAPVARCVSLHERELRSLRVRSGWILLLVLGLYLPGCEDSSVGTEPSPVGSYALVKVGAEFLPHVTARLDGGFERRIVSGEFRVQADATCSVQIDFEEGFPEEEPESYSETTGCTWTRTRNTLVLVLTSGAIDTALIQGNTLLLGTGSSQLTFER